MGLNVAADPFFTAAATGVNAGTVIVVADDNGCHSSQNEQDSRYYAKSAGVPLLEPSSSQECKDFLKRAFDISEKYDTVVLVRSHTRISHSRGIVETKEPKERPLKDYEKNVGKFVAMNYKLYVGRENNEDTFALAVELAEGLVVDNIALIENLRKRLTHELRTLLGIGCEVKFLNEGTLPRSEGKAVRVEDTRNLSENM